MIRSLLFVLLLLPTGAFAHWGHLEQAAGHDHWVIGAVIGGLVIAGILGALKGEDQAEDQDEDLQEA